jgi:hypothetical protein
MGLLNHFYRPTSHAMAWIAFIAWTATATGLIAAAARSKSM